MSNEEITLARRLTGPLESVAVPSGRYFLITDWLPRDPKVAALQTRSEGGEWQATDVMATDRDGFTHPNLCGHVDLPGGQVRLWVKEGIPPYFDACLMTL